MLFQGQSIDLFLRWDIYKNISAEQSQEPETGMKIKTAQVFFSHTSWFNKNQLVCEAQVLFQKTAIKEMPNLPVSVPKIHQIHFKGGSKTEPP